MELSLNDNFEQRELIKRDIERYNAELAETRHLSLYKRTLKHGQVYKNTIVIEDDGNVYVVSITENGLLTVHEMIEEHVIKKFEKKMHLRLLNLIEIDHWDGLKFGLCTESDVLLICELQTHPFDINIVENIFSKFNICNKGLNSSSFKEFDVYSNDVLAYSDDAILIHYKDDYDLDEGDIIINEDAERQIILSAKFLKSENETSNYILTIEDYNFVKLYHIDRISGRLNKKAELKLSEYAIYMFLQVLPKDSIKQEDTSSGRANRRRKREHDIEHAIINGEDGRILLLEINLDLEDIKVVNNSKLPIPKSLLANNKKANKNTLPMIVCMQSQNIVDSSGSFILILTHIGDLLRVNITKSIMQDETSYDMNFSQFYKIEISKKFQFITGNNSFFVLPQFGIPKFYRINNLDTKEILQIKYDDAQFEYDSLDVLCEFPNHFLKTPLIKSEVVTDKNLEASVDGMDIFCKSFKLEEKMRINIVDEDHQQINDVFEIDYEGKSKLLFFSFSDSTRVLHFNEDDEIAEIDADDAVNSGVFILKETTVKVIKNENFLLQFTKNKLNIIKIVAADKFILFKRVNLKNLLPDILEYTSSIEITNSEIIKDSKQEILLISLNNYKFFYLDLSVFINQGTLSSYMILSEIDSFLKNWKIYKHSKKLVLLFTLTSDNVLNIYEIASTLLNGDTEGSDDPLVSKFFNNGINSFLITSVEDENIENISCHVGFNDGLYEVYKFDINEKNLETVYQTYLNVHPLSLHYLSNIGNGTGRNGTVIISSLGSYWVCELNILANHVVNNVKSLYLKDLDKQLQGDIKMCNFSNDLVLENENFGKRNGTVIVDSEGELIFLVHDKSTINHIRVKDEQETVKVLDQTQLLKNNILLKDSKNLEYDIIIDGSTFCIKYDVPQHLKNKLFKGETTSTTKTFSNHEIASALIVEYSDRSLYTSSQLGKYIIMGTTKGKLLTFKINNNPKPLPEQTETKSDTKEVDEVKIDTSTLSKSQKKRLKKKQQGKECIPDKATTPKIDVDLESYEYNYLTLMNEQTFLNNQSSIKILKLLGRENYIFSILKGSIMTVFKLTNNRLEIVKENKTVPSLNQIVQIDFFYKDLLIVAADVVGNIVYHRYIPEKHVFIPLADYKLSNNYCQVLKFLDAKTILKTDRFGNLSVLALNISLSIKDLINMEHNGILERIYYDYEKHDFSKNRDDNVWHLPFKFDKVCSIYIGDIVTTVEIVKENSKIRNSRPLILCFGLQGSVTLLMPLVDELEIYAMKSVQEIVNTQEDNSYGVSKLRYESTFELTKNIYDADYHNNQNSLKKIDYKIFEILQSLQNASHLE